MDKETLGILSLIVGVFMYSRYVWAILKKQIRPHVFSWLIWAICAGVIFAAQVVENGGSGAWLMGLTSASCFLITILSLRLGANYITKSDWVALLAALCAICVWIVTKNPLSAVIIITLIDASAYFPTLRKAYSKPWEEMCLFYLLCNLSYVFSLAALETYNVTTLLNQSFLLCSNTALVAFLLLRRTVLGKERGKTTK